MTKNLRAGRPRLCVFGDDGGHARGKLDLRSAATPLKDLTVSATGRAT